MSKCLIDADALEKEMVQYAADGYAESAEDFSAYIKMLHEQQRYDVPKVHPTEFIPVEFVTRLVLDTVNGKQVMKVVQMEEIVRCKNCESYNNPRPQWCWRHGRVVAEDGFCYKGEEKEWVSDTLTQTH